jgi:hypothetical protein
MTAALPWADPGDEAPEQRGPTIQLIPIDRLNTHLKALRSGGKATPERPIRLEELPLRAVETQGGRYEVIDGFKRLERWRASGIPEVPVVLETANSELEQKVALLEANRPPRTLTPMDEARVVQSMRLDDELGPKGIAHVLGRKPSWVTTRLTLADRLSEAVARRVDTGTVGVTLAHALCALDDDAQEGVCEAVEGHGLKGQEALALVSAYRTCEHADERRALLSAPLTAVRPSERTANTCSALCTRLEEKLGGVQAALETIANFTLPDEGLALPERRRLEAEHRKVIHQLFITAQALAVEHLGIDTQEVTNETRNKANQNPGAGRGTADAKTKEEKDAPQGIDRQAREGNCPPVRNRLQHSEDRQYDGARTQVGAPRVGGQGAPRESLADTSPGKEREQAGPVQGADKGEDGEASDLHPHSARDQTGGLRRRPDHPGRLHPKEQRRARAQEEGLAPLRNRPG